MQRRTFLGTASAALLWTGAIHAQDTSPRRPLGFSLYNMKSLPISEAIAACAEIGYDCTELPLMADWPGDSAKLTGEQIKAIRVALAKHKLALTALMENLVLLDAKQHDANLKRLKRAGELAHELSPGAPPIIETILGGKDWESSKQTMVARLRDWAKVAGETKSIIAIKGHVNNAACQPEQIAWLLEQVASPHLQAAFDYSHYQLRGRTLAESFAPLARQTVFVHVKDATGEPGKFRFQLPGEGTIDYAEYRTLLDKHRYRGCIMVEVSGQISNQPGYDPIAVAKQCYKFLRGAGF